ncbi:MAG: YdiU family protein [Spirulina sp.]
MNPFLNLKYETIMEDLGEDYSDRVPAASFPEHTLRFRGDRLLPQINLNPQEVSDDHFVEAFGLFQGMRPFLALRYHGYQFGEYNPFLGDGRGFLYGQVRGTDGALYDLGTKGSGRTPYSRTADGRLTLKGGVREVLAAETLHQLGVKTSRCLSLIETGESLWRGDEPSPTRSAVMVRLSLSHIRFGTFERLHHIKRPDLMRKLLDRAIEIYYSHIPQTEEKYAIFYTELVQRTASLAAQWMAVGFCHGVLNTDNMSITGESFDYGPYAFIPTYNPRFTAAYFDYNGLYCYANQPGICKFNLERLQVPLGMVMEKSDLQAGLAKFEDYYYNEYYRLMASKLGFATLPRPQAQELVWHTVKVLEETQIGYHAFFSELAELFSHYWRKDVDEVLTNASFVLEPWETWRKLYYQRLNDFPAESMENIKSHLQYQNPKTALLRPVIESVWESIDQEDNWQPFSNLLETIWARK